MNVVEIAGGVLGILIMLAVFVMLVLLLIYTIKLVSVLPSILERLTVALEKLAKK